MCKGGVKLALAQQIVSGLASGSLYALLALSVVLIFKTINNINFAQGEMAMFSGFIAYALSQRAGFSFWTALAGALAFSVLLGLVVDRLISRPLVNAPELSFVIGTLGLNILLNSLAGILFTKQPQRFPSPFPATPINFSGLIIAREHLINLLVGVVFFLLLLVFFRFTSVGLAMRGVSQNKTVATLMGVDTKKIYSLTWIMSSFIGAFAGIFLGIIAYIEPSYMSSTIIKGFTAAVLGGLGSFPGAIFGGLLLGVMENVSGAYVSPTFKELVPMLILLLVLQFKPEGIFSVKAVKKV